MGQEAVSRPLRAFAALLALGFAVSALADPSPAYLVKDINTASTQSALMGSNRRLLVAGDSVYFAAVTPETGKELWKSDGSSAGTGLVKDAVPGSVSGLYSFGDPVGNLLYYFVQGDDGFLDLWKSDGTHDGTVLVKDF